jgi:hypothetical protein
VPGLCPVGDRGRVRVTGRQQPAEHVVVPRRRRAGPGQGLGVEPPEAVVADRHTRRVVAIGNLGRLVGHVVDRGRARHLGGGAGAAHRKQVNNRLPCVSLIQLR